MDLIEIACKQLREHPTLLENARMGGPTYLGTVLMGRCSRGPRPSTRSAKQCEKEPGKTPG